MSIDDGWNSRDKAYEDDFDRGIARDEAVTKLAEEYEKDLLAGKIIMVDGVLWHDDEMVSESNIDQARYFQAIMTGDETFIAECRESIRELLYSLAEEHIDNMEPDYD